MHKKKISVPWHLSRSPPRLLLNAPWEGVMISVAGGVQKEAGRGSCEMVMLSDGFYQQQVKR